MVVLGHYVRTNFGEMDCGKEEGFKAAYVFLFFLLIGGYVCVSSSKAKDEFKRKTFPSKSMPGSHFSILSLCTCLYVSMMCVYKFLEVGV